MSISTEAVLEQTGAQMPGEAARYLRRNFALGVISGVAFNLYVVVLSTELVMIWFLSELTHSNLLISLLIPIDLGCWYFLQLLLSGSVQRRARTLPIYQFMALIRIGALALLSLATFMLNEAGVLLIVFLSMFTVNSLAGGAAALPFLNVVAKTIPPRRRGMYFAWRRFVGGLLGLLGAALVKVILSANFALSFPDNYALLFFLGFLITVVFVGTFSFIVEPAEAVDSRRFSLRQQLRRAARLPTQRRGYRRYLILRLAVVASSYASPFYAVYARRTLHAPDDMVGTYLIGLTLASVLSNLILGQVGDRYGNRLLMRVLASSGLLAPLLALLIASIPDNGLDKSLVFTLVFVVQGVHHTARAIGSINYLLELAPPIERAIYVGAANGAVGLAVFLSPAGGAIVDWLGFESLFIFSLACSLIAVILSLGLEEPRSELAMANGSPMV